MIVVISDHDYSDLDTFDCMGDLVDHKIHNRDNGITKAKRRNKNADDDDNDDESTRSCASIGRVLFQ